MGRQGGSHAALYGVDALDLEPAAKFTHLPGRPKQPFRKEKYLQ
jgi:hypothetical protein